MERILITGANRGLGRALTAALLASGRTVFACARDAANLRESDPGATQSLVCVEMDVTDEESVRRAALRVSSETDALDVVINNAAVLLSDTVENDLADIDFAHMRRTIDVNSIGPLMIAKYFVPLLARGKRKLLLNVSSEAGSITDCRRTTWYDYCMSKAALNMASRILQNGLLDRSIKVLALHPGWIRTRMGGENAHLAPEEAAQKIIALLERNWRLSDPVFVDNTGAAMNW